MTVKQVLNTSADLDFPNVLPTLDLDFANSKTLDPRITFTRSSGGSYVGADGLIKYAGVNEARFDHDPATGESLGLLIEEDRTNLFTWSENPINAWNIRVSSPIIENSTIAPDGTLTADSFIERAPSSGLGDHYLDRTTISQAANVPLSYSIYVKRLSGIRIINLVLYANSNSSTISSQFNLDRVSSTSFSSGTGSILNSSITPLPNGWFRLSISGTPTTASVTDLRVRIQFINQGTTYIGDGTSGIYIWGAQLEQGAFPTSYIPTQGSTRTRQPDNAVITGKNFSEWYKQIGYTIFSEHITTSPSSVFPRVFNISTSTDSFRLNHYQPPQANYVGFSAVDSGVFVYADIRYSNITQFSKAKMATTYDLNNVVLYVNGNFVGKDTTNPYPSQNRDRINIGSATPNGQYINSTISRISYYPYTLKDSQLQSLTS